MPIDDDRQLRLNNLAGATQAVLGELETLSEPVESDDAALAELSERIAKDEAYAGQTSRIDIATPAARARWEQNQVEHEHAKVHGFKARQNRERDAWRKTDEGKAYRSEEARQAYWDEKGSNGDAAREYVTGLEGEAKAKHRTEQVAKAVLKHRNNRTPKKIKEDREAAAARERERWENMTPEERAAKNKARSDRRRAKAKNS